MTDQRHRWTSHGHACCRSALLATGTRPASVARCGGPGICSTCAVEASRAHLEPDEVVAVELAAEARGYRKAIAALRKEASDFAYEEGRDHTFRYAADYLEAIAEEGK